MRWLTVGITVLGALGLASSTGPAAERAVTVAVLSLLGAGVIACAIAYRVHVLRIRRAIDERGTTILRRVEPPDSDVPGERPPCTPPHPRRHRPRTADRRPRDRPPAPPGAP